MISAKKTIFANNVGTKQVRKIMPARMLVKDGGKYSGKYVATRSFKDNNVVCAGIDPVKVIQEAKNKGVQDPVLIYVPEKGMTHIY